MVDATEQRTLLLQINATTELLRSQLTAAEQAVGRFQSGVDSHLSNIDKGFANLGKGLGAVNGLLGTFANQAKGAVMGILGGGLIEATKSALEYAGGLAEAANQAGVTAHQLQVYRFAASQTGVSNEALEKGLAKLNVAMGQARNGAKAPAAAFAELSRILGVDVLKNAKQAGDAFPLLAAAMEKVTDSTKRFALERALMSRGGTQLDNLLKEGAKALDEYGAAAAKLGIILSDKQIQDAHTTAIKFAALKTELSANFAGAVANNANAILNLANALGVFIGKVGGAISGADGLYRAISQLGLIHGIQLSQSLGEEGSAHLATPAGNLGLARLRLERASAAADELPNHDRATKLHEAAANYRAAAAEFATYVKGHASATRIAAIASGGDAAGEGFLSPKGSTPKDHTAQDDAAFQGQLRQAELAFAKAEASLADTAEKQYAIQLQSLDDAEKTRERQIQDAVTAGHMTQARADQLKAVYQQTEADEKILVKRKLDIANIDQKAALEAIDLEKQKILDQLDERLATTREQHLALQLKILAAEQAQLIAADEKALADAKAANNSAKITEATAKLAADQAVIASGKQEAGVRQQNLDPLQAFGQQLNATSINDQLKQIQVDGLKGLETEMQAVIGGTKSLGQAFGDMANVVIQALEKIAIEELLIKPLQQLLGGGGGVSAFGSAAISNMGSFSMGSIIPGLADGGPVNDNSLYLVGERGPELFAPGRSGSIIPNHALRAPSMRGMGGGGGTTVIHQSFDLRGAVVTEKLYDQMHSIAGQHAQSALTAAPGLTIDTINRSHGRAVSSLGRR